jgi:hypothetical protein
MRATLTKNRNARYARRNRRAAMESAGFWTMALCLLIAAIPAAVILGAAMATFASL